MVYVFVNYTFIRPRILVWKELVCIGFLMTIVYTNYFVLFPKIYLRRYYFIYFASVILLSFACTAAEFNFTKAEIFVAYLPKIEEPISSEMQYLRRYVIIEEYVTLFLRDIAIMLALFPVLLYKETQAKYEESERRRKESERRRKETELKLKNRINNHFLMNAFVEIEELARAKSDKTEEMIAKLHKIFHHSVSMQDYDAVRINFEIDFIRDYLSLEEMVNPDMQFTFEVKGTLEQQRIPPMLFETLINNAFKYSKENTVINIELDFLKKGYIRFFCKNEYDERFLKLQPSTGKGICNLKERLETMYGVHYEMEIVHDEKNYQVEIGIPDQLPLR